MRLVDPQMITEPVGSAAALLADPVRRSALVFIAQQGQVTARDLLREWPGMTYGIGARLDLMVSHGWLRRVRVKRREFNRVRRDIHLELTPSALNDLRELHVYLGDLLDALSPTEVTADETHE